jgi:aryl-alcohol dehydrogenase-like predicted oxidoreductase
MQMDFRNLGKSGLLVSHLSLGTVSLGVNYGIDAPGDFGRPDESDVLSMLRQAADSGINLYDTAPAYGRSESALGIALGQRSGCYFATKVSIPRDEKGVMLQGRKMREAIDASLKNSRKALRRDCLDLVQIHNATVELIEQGEMVEALQDYQRAGTLRFLGASVYTQAEARAVIESGSFSSLQVAFSILDQRMAKEIFPSARKAGLGIMVRSALLKGALTAKAQWLPDELSRLRQKAEEARDVLAGGSWQMLPDIALRFCLSQPPVSTVLVGVRTAEELRSALAVQKAEPLSRDLLSRAESLALDDEYLLNPSHWPVA